MQMQPNLASHGFVLKSLAPLGVFKREAGPSSERDSSRSSQDEAVAVQVILS
jgi:hypothetical protein